ncbi:hypothetical protein [Ruegeria arenilitoris]|uniref:hypothetical protein n=1 Tax=Ruegeria arenilitoris TaxID=1173585 RepID=UPI00147F2810|nr:hypothetical protein [Ruegeria arenilitoris]
MICKSIRVPTSATGAIATYFDSQGENEEVKWIRGDKEDILLMGKVSEMCGRAYGVRHVIHSSLEPMNEQQMADAVGEYVREFNVPPDSQAQICVVEHKKPREQLPNPITVTNENGQSGAGGHEYHWHIAIPEVDTETGRVLDSSHSKIRDEKVSRIIELKYGLVITLGRFNKEVYNSLKEERPELDLSRLQKAMEEANVQAGFKREDWLEYRAYSAYSSGEHQALNRALTEVSAITGIDYKEKISLSKIKSQIRAMAQASNTALDFVGAVEAAGYEIRPGKKQGVYRLWLDDIDVGSLDRLAGRGMRRAEVEEAIFIHKSSGGKKYESTGSKTAEKTRSQTKQKSSLGVRGSDAGGHPQDHAGDLRGAGGGADGGRGQSGRHGDRPAQQSPGGTSGAARGAGLNKTGDQKLKLNPARVQRRFRNARRNRGLEKSLAQYDAYMAESGGGQIFDTDDLFMLARWAADFKQKNNIQGPG